MTLSRMYWQRLRNGAGSLRDFLTFFSFALLFAAVDWVLAAAVKTFGEPEAVTGEDISVMLKALALCIILTTATVFLILKLIYGVAI